MKKIYLAMLSLVMVLSSVACAALPIGYSWRYRVTVAVETPEGIKTGSAVREVTIAHVPTGKSSFAPPIDVKGEAVTVDLGARGVLFSLLLTDDDYIVLHAFPSPDGSGGHYSAKSVRYYNSLKNVKAALKPEHYPMFVHFRDIHDPKTVEIVYGTETFDARNERGDYTGPQTRVTDNFEKIFGAGVKIKEVTVEMTDDDVTSKIEPYMPTFGRESGFSKWQRTLNYGDSLYSFGPELLKK